MKEKGVLGEKDASILTDNIGTNAINSSFAKKVLETKERTLAYFVELRGIQKAQNDETTLNAGIERLRETGFLTKEQDKRVLEILDTEFYNGDTNNIFTSTAITYDSNNQVEAGTVTVDNIEEEKTYKGVDGLKDLIKDYAKKGLSCIDVFDKYPELFSKDNLSAFINSASSQPTRAESLNILTQASSIISALESVKPELSALTEDINAVENGLDQTDIALLKSRMETYLGKKVGTSDTEQIITKATDLMLARNGSLDAASDIITKIIFGAKELDFKDGLISLLNNFVENKKGNWLELAKKGALLSLLVIASNDKVNYEKEIFNVADFFVNVVGKNDLYADVLTKTGDYLESPEYLELGLDKVLKEKALNVIDEINKGVEDINK